MLANSSAFICKEEVDIAYRVTSYNTNRVVEQLYSQFKVVEKLYQDMILGFDWFQSVNPQVDRFNCGVTLYSGFVAASGPIYHNTKVKLYSFKAFIHLLYANKLKNGCFISVQ